MFFFPLLGISGGMLLLKFSLLLELSLHGFHLLLTLQLLGFFLEQHFNPLPNGTLALVKHNEFLFFPCKVTEVLMNLLLNQRTQHCVWNHMSQLSSLLSVLLMHHVHFS